MSSKVKLTICILSGRDILSPFGKDCSIKVTGTLESTTITTGIVQLKNTEASFETELVWLITKNHFQGLRSRRSNIVLSVLASDGDRNEQRIGAMVIDLREVVPMNPNISTASYSAVANWRPLINSKSIPGKGPPSLNLSCVLEEISVPTIQVIEAEDVVEEMDLTDNTLQRDDSDVIFDHEVPAHSQASNPSQGDVSQVNQAGAPGPSQDVMPRPSHAVTHGSSQAVTQGPSQAVLPGPSQAVVPSPSQAVVPGGSRKTVQDTRLTPKLLPDKKCFLIGDETQEGLVTVYLNVFVAFGRELQKLRPDGFVSSSKSREYYFEYDLMNYKIETTTFDDLMLANFSAEKATARIVATPDALSQYFSELEPYVFTLMGNSQPLGRAQFDWKTFFKVTPDKIIRGDSIIYDGVLPIMKISQTNSSSSWTDPNHPVLGIRVSLTKDPDLGTASLSESQGVLDRPREREKSAFESKSHGGILQTENQSTIVPISQDSRSDKPDESGSHESPKSSCPRGPIKYVDPKKAKYTDIEVLDSVRVDNSKRSITDVQKRFKFSVTLKLIQINCQSNFNCVIQYKYPVFCDQVISTTPPCSIEPGKPVDLRDFNSFCEFSFNYNEQGLQRKFAKHFLKFNIMALTRDGSQEKVGFSRVDLSQLLSSPRCADFEGNSIRDLPIVVPICDVKGQTVIGKLKMKLKLTDEGRTSIQNTEPSTSRLQRTLEADEENESRQISERVDKEVRKRLLAAESSHLSLLSKEWEKREKERFEFEEKMRKELNQEKSELEKMVKEEREKIKAKTDELTRRESILIDREERLKKTEDRLKKQEGDIEKLVAMRMKSKEKELEKTIQTLRSENLELKRNQTLQRQELVVLRKRCEKKETREAKQIKETSEVQPSAVITEDVRILWDHLGKAFKNQVQLSCQNNNNAGLDNQTGSNFSQPPQTSDHTKSSMPTGIDTKATGIDTESTTNSSLLRLQHQKSVLLRSRSYKESDELIKVIDREIEKVKSRTNSK